MTGCNNSLSSNSRRVSPVDSFGNDSLLEDVNMMGDVDNFNNPDY